MIERLVLLAVVCFLTAAVWAQSVAGRQAVIDAQRQDCQRLQLTRWADARAWYGAYQARLLQAEHERVPALRLTYIETARQYWDTAWVLNHFVNAYYSLTVDGKHPLGLGTLDCAHAYRDASAFSFFH